MSDIETRQAEHLRKVAEYEKRVQRAYQIATAAEGRNFSGKEVAALIDAANGTQFRQAMIDASNSRNRNEEMAGVISDMTAEVEALRHNSPETRAINERAAAMVAKGTREADEAKARPEFRGLLPSRAELVEHRAYNTGDHLDLAPTQVSNEFVDLLVANSRFLSVMSDAGSVVRMTGTSLHIPQLVGEDDAAIVAEGAEIVSGDDEWEGLLVNTLKVAVGRRASNEILDDSQLDLRRLVAQSMARRAAVLYDGQVFGAGNGTTAVKGITASGKFTGITQGTGRTVIDYEGILQACSAIEATDASPTTVFLSTTAAQALRAVRTDSGDGEWLGMPDELRSLRWVTSARVPAGKAIVLAADRVIVPIRTDVKLFVSEHRYAEFDQVYFRTTWRVGNEVIVPEATSVQVVTPAAS